jgi:hypothetical protein
LLAFLQIKWPLAGGVGQLFFDKRSRDDLFVSMDELGQRGRSRSGTRQSSVAISRKSDDFRYKGEGRPRSGTRQSSVAFPPSTGGVSNSSQEAKNLPALPPQFVGFRAFQKEHYELMYS